MTTTKAIITPIQGIKSQSVILVVFRCTSNLGFLRQSLAFHKNVEITSSSGTTVAAIFTLGRHKDAIEEIKNLCRYHLSIANSNITTTMSCNFDAAAAIAALFHNDFGAITEFLRTLR